jgi:hypothetical protein
VRALAAVFLAVPLAGFAQAQPVDERFRAANDLARAADYPKAAAAYEAIAAAGSESASLYWNWAQSARARGALGEALWALLRARELEPGDAAVLRAAAEIAAELKLDPAELEPEPLAAVARFARRLRLDWLAVGLGAASVALHALRRARVRAGAPALGWMAFALAVLAALPVLAGAGSRPTGVVASRGAALLEAASPSAKETAALREGEVVPILGESGEYLRVEDSSGARGWAHASDVRRLDRAPRGR